MPEIHTVAPEQLPPLGEGRSIIVGRKDIALFRVEDEYHAIENECPHAGAPLHDGYLEECVVSCPWHGWQFDVTDGRCVMVEGYNLKSYPVHVDNGVVQIEIE